MTMYLPNPDLHPTGYEPAEFIDAHRAAEPGDRRPALWGLVESHHGDSEDVRSAIHDLHDQSPFTDHDRGL